MKRILQPTWLGRIQRPYQYTPLSLPTFTWIRDTPCYGRAWHLHEYITPVSSISDFTVYSSSSDIDQLLEMYNMLSTPPPSPSSHYRGEDDINHELVVSALNENDYWELIEHLSSPTHRPMPF